jgi:hypothetical protein
MEELQEFLNANMKRTGMEDEMRASLVRLKQLEMERLQRLQLASRVEWFENDEKSTAFFYNRIKQGQANSNVVSLQVDQRTLGEKEINDHIHTFLLLTLQVKDI